MADPYAPPPYDEKAPPPPMMVQESHQQTAHPVIVQPVVAQPTPVVIQQQPVQPTVVIQQQQPQVVVTQPNVVVVAAVKDAPCFESYTEHCPYCHVSVVTNVRYEWGSTTWCYLIISLIICWPLIFAICCECSKDAYHHCPRCQRLLAIKRR